MPDDGPAVAAVGTEKLVLVNETDVCCAAGHRTFVRVFHQGSQFLHTFLSLQQNVHFQESFVKGSLEILSQKLFVFYQSWDEIFLHEKSNFRPPVSVENSEHRNLVTQIRLSYMRVLHFGSPT